jgi:hypothetical protein
MIVGDMAGSNQWESPITTISNI